MQMLAVLYDEAMRQGKASILLAVHMHVPLTRA
jgi:hypothetical protein